MSVRIDRSTLLRLVNGDRVHASSRGIRVCRCVRSRAIGAALVIHRANVAIVAELP